MAEQAPPVLSVGQWMENRNEWPVAQRIAGYHQLKKDSLAAFNFDDERALNQYGYALLYSGKPLEAIEIFKLLVAEFPARSNPYDSLAEAYKSQGNEALAILNYEKAYAMNPENTYAKFEVDRMSGRLDLFATDWGKEIFQIPLRFAPEMTLTGVEDARFTKDWGTAGSDEFWTYAFAWSVDQEAGATVAVMEENISLYFEGLMSRQKDELKGTAITRFERTGEQGGVTTYEGRLNFMDTRLTKDRLTLNVQAESRLCGDGGAIIAFWFSPKPYGHPVWTKLRTVKVIPDVCLRE